MTPDAAVTATAVTPRKSTKWNDEITFCAAFLSLGEVERTKVTYAVVTASWGDAKNPKRTLAYATAAEAMWRASDIGPPPAKGLAEHQQADKDARAAQQKP